MAGYRVNFRVGHSKVSPDYSHIMLATSVCCVREHEAEPISSLGVTTSSQRYPYFDVIVGLAWSNDSESYAGDSVATGTAFHARQVKGDEPYKKNPTS
jgi:hypothetical protein